jgi:hypothetical protein
MLVGARISPKCKVARPILLFDIYVNQMAKTKIASIYKTILGTRFGISI